MATDIKYYESLRELFNNNAQNFDATYSNSPEKIERYRIWTSCIEKYSGLINATTCLDIGCGSGVLSLFTAKMGLEVTGIDMSDEMLKICQSKKDQLGISKINFKNMTLEQIDTTLVSKFDLIICSSVLEYIDNIHSSLLSIFKILSKKGIALISLPNKSSFYRKYFNIKYQLFGKPEYIKFVKNSYSIEDATNLIHDTGFNIVDYKYYGLESIRTPSLIQKVFDERFHANMILFVLKRTSL